MSSKRTAEILTAYDWRHLTPEEIITKLENDFFLIPKQEERSRLSSSQSETKNRKSCVQNKNRNPRTQFELHTLDYSSDVIRKAYNWCIKNLPLTDSNGIRYTGSELLITTRSQKVLDKVNAQFGSNFSFNHQIGDTRYCISAENFFK